MVLILCYNFKFEWIFGKGSRRRISDVLYISPSLLSTVGHCRARNKERKPNTKSTRFTPPTVFCARILQLSIPKRKEQITGAPLINHCWLEAPKFPIYIAPLISRLLPPLIQDSALVLSVSLEGCGVLSDTSVGRAVIGSPYPLLI